jgi:hypothetical protein
MSPITKISWDDNQAGTVIAYINSKTREFIRQFGEPNPGWHLVWKEELSRLSNDASKIEVSDEIYKIFPENKKFDAVRIKQLYSRSYPVEVICGQLNLSRSTVYRYLNKMGLIKKRG